jgi:hypothetical protein
LALVTLAGSAGLAAKITRLAGGDPVRFEGLARDFLEGAQRDGDAYLAARLGGEANVRACVHLAADQLESAVAFLEALEPLFEGLSPGVKADMAAVERFARTAARVLLVNLAVNLSEWSERFVGLEDTCPNLADLERRLEQL